MTAAPPADGGAAILESPAPDSTPQNVESAALLGSFDYFRQVLPQPPTVCGLPIKPLSIGRYRRMRRLGVAFVADDPQFPTAGDLLKGVLVCSMTCADYDAFIASPDCGAEIKRWGQRIGLLPPRYLDWPIVGGWINRFVGEEITLRRAVRDANYVIEQIELFQKYIADAQVIPNYTQKENNPSRHSLHWSNTIELHLRCEQNWTSDEIEEAPLSKALTDYFGYAESHGLISILTDAEIEQAQDNSQKVEAAFNEWRDKHPRAAALAAAGAPAADIAQAAQEESDQTAANN